MAGAAQEEQPDGQDDDDPHADRRHDLDLRREARPEAPEARGEAEARDREQVEDPLHEDGPEGPRERGVAVDLEQVGAVHVAELGRDHAVDEPGQEDDLGRVLRRAVEAGAAQEKRPAVAAQGEAEVVDRERRRDEERAGVEDQPRDLGQLVAVEADEDGDDDERDEDRDDRPRLAQPAPEGDLLDRDLPFRGRGGLAGGGVEGGAGRGAHRPGPATGRIRPFPRARWTSLATGVTARTK